MSSHKQLEMIGAHPELIDPYGNYIVVQVMKAEKATAGGIHLPDELVDRDRQTIARVVKVGPGQRSITTGEFMKPHSEPGDLVVILKHAPIELKMGGQVFHMLAEGDVLGKVNETILTRLLEEEAAPEPEAAAETPAAAAPETAAPTAPVAETEDATVHARPSGLFIVQAKS